MDAERRCFESEMRAESGFGGARLVGYAAVFNSLTDERMFGGQFREQIAPGAFARALKSGRDVVALFNHNADHVLGRLSNKTLKLREDARGLQIEVALPDTTLGRDLHRLVERGDIHQMSFTFRTRPGGETWAKQGKTAIRTLTDVDLDDVSIVTVPAYPETSVAARQLAVEILRGGDSAEADGLRRSLELLELEG